MDHIALLSQRYPSLAECAPAIGQAADRLAAMYQNGNKLLLCGNGGSAADCEHISGELLKGFLSRRPLGAFLPGLPEDIHARLQKGIAAIPLTSLSASLSAFANDVDPALAYAQLVAAFGRQGDVFWGISTSGNAANVYAAACVAKEAGLTVIGLTGAAGGKLAGISDIAIRVPETETFRIQEYHLPVYHAICAQTEQICFEN